MKNVMTRAWEIAREGVQKFGGRIKEYFAQALVMAWAEIKKGVEKVEKTFATLETQTGSRNNKTWVAEIKGACEQYGLKRNFINPSKDEYGEKEFRLFNGITYDVCDGGNRFMVKVENGEIIKL